MARRAFHGGLGQHVGIGNQRADVVLEQHQPFVDLIVLGSLVHLDLQIAVGHALYIGDERLKPAMHAVDRLLHLLVVALAGNFHPLPQIAATDQAQHAVAFTDGDEDGVEHDVHAAQHLGIGPLELLGFAALGKLALLGGFGQAQQLLLQSKQHPDDLDQALGNGVVFGADVDLHRKVAGSNGLGGIRLLIDGFDAGVEVVLEDVEIAVVVVGDLRGDVTLGDLVDIIGGDVQRPNHRIERVVDALDDLAEVAMVLRCVGSCGELAIDSGFAQHVGVRHKRVHRVDAGVEVVLEDVEIAVVVVGDLGRDVALGDLIDVVGGHVQRPNHRIERLVDALDDLAEVALMLGGIGAGGELALHGRN